MFFLRLLFFFIWFFLLPLWFFTRFVFWFRCLLLIRGRLYIFLSFLEAFLWEMFFFLFNWCFWLGTWFWLWNDIAFNFDFLPASLLSLLLIVRYILWDWFLVIRSVSAKLLNDPPLLLFWNFYLLAIWSCSELSPGSSGLSIKESWFFLHSIFFVNDLLLLVYTWSFLFYRSSWFSTSFFWRTFPRLVFLFILLIWFCCFGFTFRLVLFLLYFLLLCNLGHYSWIFFGLHIRISVFVLFAFLFVLLFVLLYSLLPFISLLLFNWIMLFLILVLFLFLQFILFF